MRLFELRQPETRTLYVCRHLKNTKDIIDWAKSQGFETCLPAEEFHVTIAYSKEKVQWDNTIPLKNTIRVKGGKRSLEKFGSDKNVVVLCFESADLQDRWAYLVDDVGCSWDYEGYHPHVTITYDGKSVDIKDMTAYDGELVFGPEKFSEIINGDYKDNFEEIDLSEE